ncbi:MAG: PASTA domain-containing protein [Bulleidia sp.]|nr:PASTA domain-containing protein [Erysipelotrichaceae bacterium 7770_A6]MEE0559320.1 PASTA domain-containing protein [Bulleidia sp.]
MKNRKLKKSVKIILCGIFMGVIATATTIGLLAMNGSSVKVVNFVNQKKSDVEKWRKDNDIDASQIIYKYEYSEEKDKNVVLKQSLKAGESMNKDNDLKITLSNGADPSVTFELPDFTGKKEDEIKQWFKDKKFSNVVYKYEKNPDIEENTFISMDPAASTTVKRSDTVTVTICAPLEGAEVSMIDMSSMSKDEINAWAEENKITIIYDEAYSDSIASGKVITTSVDANTIIHQGDTVTVTLSKGKQKTEAEVQQTQSTKPSGDTSASATDETKNSSQGSTVTTQTPTTSGSGEVVSKPSETQPVVPPTTEVEQPKPQCKNPVQALYNGKSGDEIQASLSTNGCAVYINYLDNESNNPDSISGGIHSYTNNGDSLSVNVYKSWK